MIKVSVNSAMTIALFKDLTALKLYPSERTEVSFFRISEEEAREKVLYEDDAIYSETQVTYIEEVDEFEVML